MHNNLFAIFRTRGQVDKQIDDKLLTRGITIVATNYSSLNTSNTPEISNGEFAWVREAQGTAWLPGTLGGTYYPSGLYWCNGIAWVSTPIPYQATAAEVATGTVVDKFVSPATLSPFLNYGAGDFKISVRASDHGSWLLCDARAVSRTVYSSLFNVIGTSFGAGDGSTTFNLPDPRGRALAVSGSGTGLTSRTLGAKVGTETHTLTIGEMPNHNHSVQGYVRTDFDTNDVFSNYSGLDTGGNRYNTDSVGGGAAHNNMQPTLFIGNLFIFHR